jgi:hypothetical protein
MRTGWDKISGRSWARKSPLLKRASAQITRNNASDQLFIILVGNLLAYQQSFQATVGCQ